MIEWEQLPDLRSPIMVTAFEGWNDAGEAATDAIDHLRQIWPSNPLGELDPDDYYDFQVTRPHIRVEEEGRSVTWPTTRVILAAAPERDIIIVHGIEPNMRWRSFCDEILGIARDLGIERIVNLGALLADVPHTRPVPLTAFASDAGLVKALGLEPSAYAGPTGIVGVLQHAAEVAQIPALSLWAAIPHYVSAAPCPKATLAMLQQLQDIMEVSIPLGELPEEAQAWQRGVEEMAAADDEIGEYIAQLERARDSENLPEASGDAIAAEFERYLRHRGH